MPRNEYKEQRESAMNRAIFNQRQVFRLLKIKQIRCILLHRSVCSAASLKSLKCLVLCYFTFWENWQNQNNGGTARSAVLQRNSSPPWITQNPHDWKNSWTFRKRLIKCTRLVSEKVQDMKLCRIVLEVIMSYLTEKQFKAINIEASHVLNFSSPVPEGSFLGPLLFLNILTKEECVWEFSSCRVSLSCPKLAFSDVIRESNHLV